MNISYRIRKIKTNKGFNSINYYHKEERGKGNKIIEKEWNKKGII